MSQRLSFLAAYKALGRREGWLGLALVCALALTSTWLARLPAVAHTGLSPLTLAIALGILCGNSFFTYIATGTGIGVDFAKSTLLRVGIVLYGFRITFQQIAALGWSAAIIDVIMLAGCILLALWFGRLLRVDSETSLLIGAGSGICGAAAVMAVEPVIGAPPHKVSVAIATVVVFGTASMFLYPAAYSSLGLSPVTYGTYVGSTVHEVAQVVAAGRGVSAAAADAAVIVKMLRVMLLAPFLLILSLRAAGQKGQTRSRLEIPWFAVLFIAAAGLNSLQCLPPSVVAQVSQADTFVLAAAMAALGIRTQVSAIRQAGTRPLLLAAGLFAFLTVGGYFINRAFGAANI